MKYISVILVICFGIVSPVLGASNPRMSNPVEQEDSTSRLSMEQTPRNSLLRRRNLQEEEEDRTGEAGPATNRLAFAETSSGRLVLITSGSLVGIVIIYFFLHDYLYKACCSKTTTCNNNHVDEGIDDKDTKETKMEQTTRSGLGTVEEDLSNSDDKSAESGDDSALVK